MALGALCITPLPDRGSLLSGSDNGRVLRFRV
jgi:hypothetical protein